MSRLTGSRSLVSFAGSLAAGLVVVALGYIGGGEAYLSSPTIWGLAIWLAAVLGVLIAHGTRSGPVSLTERVLSLVIVGLAVVTAAPAVFVFFWIVWRPFDPQ